MNISSTLNSELVRIFAAILLPGAILVLSAMGLVSVWTYGSLKEALLAFDPLLQLAAVWQVPAGLTLFTLVVAGGVFAESLGSWFEDLVSTRCLKKKYTDYESVWNQYLTLAFEHDPVGQKYIRYLILHLKFELNMGTALFLGTVSLGWLDRCDAAFNIPCAIYTATILLAAFLFYDSCSTAKLLHKVRSQLVEKYGIH